jgi:uncharacterized membrane-anchored protein YjiN (DUF445 family)
MIERGLSERIRAIQVGPLLGNILAVVTADRRHQELLDEALRIASRAATENEELIRKRVSEETPWWVPDLVDEKIHAKIVGGIERTLAQVADDPNHLLRQRFDVALNDFIERLRHSPEAIARAEAIKQEVLDHPALREFAASLWTDAREALARRLESPAPGEISSAVDSGVPGSSSVPDDSGNSGASDDSALSADLGSCGSGSGDFGSGSGAPVVPGNSAEPDIIVQALTGLADAVLDDPALLAKINGWITDTVVHAVSQYRDEVGQLIEQTVAGWDADATSDKIELQIGRDLQFVRINGTIVGGLVGLVLYTLSRWWF